MKPKSKFAIREDKLVAMQRHLEEVEEMLKTTLVEIYAADIVNRTYVDRDDHGAAQEIFDSAARTFERLDRSMGHYCRFDRTYQVEGINSKQFEKLIGHLCEKFDSAAIKYHDAELRVFRVDGFRLIEICDAACSWGMRYTNFRLRTWL